MLISRRTSLKTRLKMLTQKRRNKWKIIKLINLRIELDGNFFDILCSGNFPMFEPINTFLNRVTNILVVFRFFPDILAAELYIRVNLYLLQNFYAI